MAAWGLCCCARAFFSCGEGALLFLAVRGFLIVVASLSLSIYIYWARTRVACIGRRILNHCATREVPLLALSWVTCSGKIQLPCHEETPKALLKKSMVELSWWCRD